MSKRWRNAIIVVLAVLALVAWFLLSYRDRLFVMPRLRDALLESAPTAPETALRGEYMGTRGALCGSIRGIEGGERFSAQVRDRGAAARSSTSTSAPAAPLVAMGAPDWRRFIVVPSVPAFYVEGLAPWALSLDGKKFEIDKLELATISDGFREQYGLAAAIDGIDAQRTQREITLKSLSEMFEIAWSRDCSPS